MSSVPPPVLIIRGSEVAALMDHAAYLTAVEAGFRSYANGDACVPMPMHIPAQDGGFHAKGALVVLDRPYVAVKVNGNFPENQRRTGLPTIQGAVLLFDAAAGSLLAVIDSIEITLRRTAAASALAARYLARADADSIAICGCGDQGRSQLAALAEVVTLKRAFAWDISMDKAHDFADEMQGALGLEVTAVPHVYDATRRSDIIVTATSAQRPFLTKDCVSVVDVLAQCAVMGDLHHALDAGLVSSADVHAELGDLVVGRKPGRTNPREITVFDSTGVAIQDAASAAWVYQRAVARNIGTPISLGAA